MQKSITSNEQKTTTTNEEPLMTVMDVASYLKVSRSWVYQHAASGQLPSRKIGGNLRFIPSEVREFARVGQGTAGRGAAGQATSSRAHDRLRAANG